jgi:hypothetical protein
VHTSAAEALPHTRAPLTHWIVTVLACTAAVAAAVLIRPTEVAASPADSASPAGSVNPAAPDPDAAEFPLDCAGTPVAVAKRVSADVDGDGRQDTVAAVHCDAGNGTPPHGVYVLSAGLRPGAPPRVVAVFLDPKEQLTVASLVFREGKVAAKLLGYSSDAVPRCCPDQESTRVWRWKSGKFTAVQVQGAPAA